MVSESRVEMQEEYKRAVEERAGIVRAIARNISAMDQTSISSGEVITESRQLIARLDRLIRRS